MTSSFNCPNCGAQIPYSNEGNTTRCPFCGSEIPVPAEMANEASAKKLRSKVWTWAIIFIFFVFILPTCLTVGGSAFGFLGAIVSVIVSIFTTFFRH